MESTFQPNYARTSIGMFDSEDVSPANNVKAFREKRTFTNQFLSELPRPVLEKLQAFLRPVSLSREDYVYQPEDRVSYLYFPETAVFTEYQMLKDGRTIEIALTGAESAIGLASMSYSCRAASWTQVCTSGTAYKIESEQFRSIAGQNPGVRELINEYLNSYICEISHKVICNAHHLIEQRLCAWLLMLQDRCGSGPVLVTQEQLARILGAHRPSVTCIAQYLREKNIIDYTRGKIVIVDRNALANTACSCYSEISGRRSNGIAPRSINSARPPF